MIYLHISKPNSIRLIVKEILLMGITWCLTKLIHLSVDHAISHHSPNHSCEKRSQRPAKRTTKWKAFNFLLSSQRITIEREFGMLVRKWGILWRPLGYPLDTNVLITFVCAKLHNFCLRSWHARSTRTAEYRLIVEQHDQLKSRRESSMFMKWISAETSEDSFDFDDVEDENGPNDKEVISIMSNQRPSKQRASPSNNKKKWNMVEQIYNCGICYTAETDVHFLWIYSTNLRRNRCHRDCASTHGCLLAQCEA